MNSYEQIAEKIATLEYQLDMLIDKVSSVNQELNAKSTTAIGPKPGSVVLSGFEITDIEDLWDLVGNNEVDENDAKFVETFYGYLDQARQNEHEPFMSKKQHKVLRSLIERYLDAGQS